MNLFDEDEVPVKSDAGKRRKEKTANTEDAAEDNFSINSKFAVRFEREKRFQDLQNAKSISLQGDSDDELDDSSASESEDEEGEGLDPALEIKVKLTMPAFV